VRTYDLLLFGATGFSGKLVAAYLARRDTNVTWALAGRSRDKLEAVRTAIGRPELPIEIADTGDIAALDRVVPLARVVCTTVGPYRRHGVELARACARHGTHYCDITGEVPFMRASIDDNHELAQRTGARIVHACGFDSIPSDLGVLALRERAGEDLAWVKADVHVSGRGAPGGVETAIALMSDARRDRSLLRTARNRNALAVEPGRAGPDGPDQLGVRFDRELGAWTGPFVMATVNTRVVRRSADLLGYGAGFRYDECLAFGRGPLGLAKAGLAAGALAAIFTAASMPRAHALLRRHVRPDIVRRGGYTIRMVGETVSGRRLEVRISGDGDPGCEPTAMMVAESALSLAFDRHAPTGVLTPAVLGTDLLERVRRNGMAVAAA